MLTNTLLSSFYLQGFYGFNEAGSYVYGHGSSVRGSSVRSNVRSAFMEYRARGCVGLYGWHSVLILTTGLRAVPASTGSMS